MGEGMLVYWPVLTPSKSSVANSLEHDTCDDYSPGPSMVKVRSPTAACDGRTARASRAMMKAASRPSESAVCVELFDVFISFVSLK